MVSTQLRGPRGSGETGPGDQGGEGLGGSCRARWKEGPGMQGWQHRPGESWPRGTKQANKHKH